MRVSKSLNTFFTALIATVLLFASSLSHAIIETYEFEVVEQREQFSRMNEVLRCPLCQNQSIADSSAPIANDLRREVHRLITEEQANDDEIVEFMLIRYGDFVLYRPPLDSRTIALWFGPLFLLLLGVLTLFRMFRRINSDSGEEGMTQSEKEKVAQILDGEMS